MTSFCDITGNLCALISLFIFMAKNEMIYLVSVCFFSCFVSSVRDLHQTKTVPPWDRDDSCAVTDECLEFQVNRQPKFLL